MDIDGLNPHMYYIAPSATKIHLLKTVVENNEEHYNL